MARSTFSFYPSTLMGSNAAGSTSGFPDWVLLWEEPRFSELRNETTAECQTSDGQTVEVSFWLVDPPGVSYFSFNCPGLDASVFHEYEPPSLVCAEAAFVVFSLSFRGSIHHFVYRAAPAGKQSLQLLPDRDPNSTVFRRAGFGLLPSRDGEHYAVAYLDRQCVTKDFDWWFHAHVFSSETRAWSSHRPSLLHLSESEKLMCCRHGLSQQIAVAGSLGWVDLMSGILLLCNLLDGNPVIKFIPFPESRVSFLDEDGHPERAPAYYCNVACYDDVIKFIEIDFDDPVVRTSGQGWRTTMWERKISWNKWQIRSTVDVARIFVDQSYSALLPEMRQGDDGDETQKLDLKKLIFYTPVPSRRNDDLFYMMAKVNANDETAWAVAVDMERAAVEAMAPFSLGRYKYHITMYCSCDFPKYLNMTPDMHNPVDKCFKRLSAKHCVVQVLWTLDRLQELDQCLQIERSTYNTCRLLLQFSPVSSLRSSIRSMVVHASYNAQGEAASEAVEFCLRALEDFDLALHESPSNWLASIEAMRSKIIDIIEALENILQIVPSTLMPKGRMLGEASDQKRGKTIFETCEKPSREGAVVSGGRWLLSLIGCLRISIVLLCHLPWIIVTGIIILITSYLYGIFVVCRYMSLL